MPFMKPTPEQIATYRGWEAAYADLAAKMEAFRIMFGRPTVLGPGETVAFHLNGGGGSGDDDDNMTAAIEDIVGKLPAGGAISYKALRGELRRRGFPESRLQNYVYTAIHRLNKKDRIRLNNDKTLSRAGGQE